MRRGIQTAGFAVLGSLMLLIQPFGWCATARDAEPDAATSRFTIQAGVLFDHENEGGAIVPDIPPGAIVVDRYPRMLGGDVADHLAPKIKLPFGVSTGGGGGVPILTIGRIDGLNTAEAHALGQSDAPYVSSPVVIKVNGKRIHYVTRNGESVQVEIPPAVMRPYGLNMIQIEAGYYLPGGNRIAYDTIRFQNVSIQFEDDRLSRR
jgi:hypothetical protein